MFYYSFSLLDPVLYYKGGEFSADIPWQHNPMYHRGDYEIIVCMKGTFYIQVKSTRYVIRQHDVLLVPPFSKMFGYRKSASPVDFYWLHFFIKKKPTLIYETGLASKVFGMSSDYSRNSNLDDPVILPSQFHLQDMGKFIILVHQILDVSSRNRYGQQESDYLMTAFLIELSNHFLNQCLEQKGYINKIARLKEWIRANMSSDLNVKQIADATQLNADYLTRLFKRYTGMTTLQYLTRLKIEVAQLLLLRTNLTVKQISIYAYFTDEKLFMRRFKAQTGLTPTEYRNAYTHTHLNNPHIDPKIPVPKQIEDKIDNIIDNVNEGFTDTSK
ncbi:AraC family transcriptional regulator [Clostridium ljungdahlii]|uniref:AraC family transcriptional regulator n=1 Tax=Clostridium ljungdahlii TaxID=1538 RepID=UPI003870D967